MADFEQPTINKTALRDLTVPIADVESFNTLVESVITDNPFGCVGYTTKAGERTPSTSSTTPGWSSSRGVSPTLTYYERPSPVRPASSAAIRAPVGEEAARCRGEGLRGARRGWRFLGLRRHPDSGVVPVPTRYCRCSGGSGSAGQ